MRKTIAWIVMIIGVLGLSVTVGVGFNLLSLIISVLALINGAIILWRIKEDKETNMADNVLLASGLALALLIVSILYLV